MLSATSETKSPLPCLESPPDLRRTAFDTNSNNKISTEASTRDEDATFDLILFCHSMYGMKPKRKFIECALNMLGNQPEDGLVVIFHRAGALDLEGLVCHRTASFPTGIVRMSDDDRVLDQFAAFIAGFNTSNATHDEAIHVGWPKVCRALSRREETHPHQLSFSSPHIVLAFNRHAM
jgi:hypothetical protein